MKNLETQAGTTEVDFANKIQEMEERISGTEDTVEEMNTLVKGNPKSKKIPETKHPENLGHYERINRNTGRRRNRAQRPRQYSQQNHRRKYS